jgi:hypothetical protein
MGEIVQNKVRRNLPRLQIGAEGREGIHESG